MVSMNAGRLDHRNIGSTISLPTGKNGAIVSGAIALVIQRGAETDILLAHDEELITISKSAEVDIALPPVAAYTLGMKNAVEELVARFKVE